jgi:hypothetical protein
MSPDNHENPEWFEIVLLMQDMGRKLPEDWDHDTEFLLGAVQCLAELVIACRGKVPIETLGAAIGAGGILIAEAVKQAEAADMTSLLLQRLRRDGGVRD